MYPAFAYSSQMQIILAFINFLETFTTMYLLSKILMTVFNISATSKQRFLFALITGTLLQNVFIYGIFILGGMKSFTQLQYLIIVSPNPISALIYYYSAKKIFKLSHARSIKLVSYVYLFWVTIKTLNWLNICLFFRQTEIDYNYMKDALQLVLYFLQFTALYFIAQKVLKIYRTNLKFVDIMFINKKKETVGFFIKALFAYSIRIIIPLLITNQTVAYLIIFLILNMFIVLNICFDIIASKKQVISNQEIHISTLFKGMEELKGIKHDFNNVLHIYSGFLELGEFSKLKDYHASLISSNSYESSIMDLAQKIDENPSVITLLINKLEYAEKMSVKMRVSLSFDLNNLYIDNMDLVKILDCLLDNAIEGASNSLQHKVYLTFKSKDDNSKLIIITNSTDKHIDTDAIIKSGTTTKTGHKETGLSIINSILAKYGNCSFQIKYFDHEFSSYLELKNNI